MSAPRPVSVPAGSIQVTRSGFACRLPPGPFAALKRRFKKALVLRLPGFLSRDLLAPLQRRLAGESFHERRNATERRQILRDPSINTDLLFLLGSRGLFETLRGLSGCPPITRAGGCLYRMASAGHHLDWHQDTWEHGVLGMTINLSPRPFSGGVFQLKRAGATAVLAEVPRTDAGDAILFGISPGLLHRSTPLSGRNPKVVFSCWFRSGDGPAVAWPGMPR